MTKIGTIVCLLAPLAFAMVESLPIPRVQSTFRTEGIFDGGSQSKANLEAIRLGMHHKEGYERWVIDFSDATTRKPGIVAPQFQIRLLSAIPQTNEPRLVLALGSIASSFIKPTQTMNLLKKSGLVKDITIYPPIEGGDLSIEFVLKPGVRFSPHQPIEKEGRLVIDLKPATKRILANGAVRE